MLNCNKILAALLVVTATCSIVTAILPPSNPFDRFDFFEEDTCYAGSKKSCSSNPRWIGKNFQLFLILRAFYNHHLLQYGSWEFHYVPLASAYYVARMADALGYGDCCPTNLTFLRSLNIMVPWSGKHLGVAIGKVEYSF